MSDPVLLRMTVLLMVVRLLVLLILLVLNLLVMRVLRLLVTLLTPFVLPSPAPLAPTTSASTSPSGILDPSGSACAEAAVRHTGDPVRIPTGRRGPLALLVLRLVRGAVRWIEIGHPIVLSHILLLLRRKLRRTTRITVGELMGMVLGRRRSRPLPRDKRISRPRPKLRSPRPCGGLRCPFRPAEDPVIVRGTQPLLLLSVYSCAVSASSAPPASTTAAPLFRHRALDCRALSQELLP